MDAVITPGISSLGARVDSSVTPNFVIGYVAGEPPAPSTYTPISQSNLVHWIDFTDNSTVWETSGSVLASSGSTITFVEDKKGNFHLTNVGTTVVYNDSASFGGYNMYYNPAGATGYLACTPDVTCSHVYIVLAEDAGEDADYHFFLGDDSSYSLHGGNNHVLYAPFGTVDSFRVDQVAGTANVTLRPTQLKVCSFLDSSKGFIYSRMAADRGIARYWHGYVMLLLAYDNLNPTAGSIVEIENSIKDHFGI